MNIFTSVPLSVALSFLCVCAPTLIAIKTLRLASYPTRHGRHKGYAFLLRIVSVTIRKTFFKHSLTNDELTERKLFSNVADNIVLLISVELVSITIFIATVFDLINNSVENDYIVLLILCSGNSLAVAIQYTILNKERRIFEGKDRLGVAAKNDDDLHVDEPNASTWERKLAEGKSVSHFDAFELEALVRSTMHDWQTSLERDRSRVISAWSQSPLRPLIEFKDAESNDPKMKRDTE